MDQTNDSVKPIYHDNNGNQWSWDAIPYLPDNRLANDIKYPVKYVHDSGAISVCRDQLELRSAMMYDHKLVVLPGLVFIVSIAAMVVIADHFGYIQ